MGNYPLRFKEWRICQDDTAYVMGAAAAAGQGNYLDNYKEKLTRRLEELKSNPEQMSRLDLNKDGQINMEEWDLAVAKVEQELLAGELNSCPSNTQIDVVISKGEKGEVFIISDYSQKDLVRKLSWQAFSGVFGGAALALAMLWYLLFRLNCFRF